MNSISQQASVLRPGDDHSQSRRWTREEAAIFEEEVAKHVTDVNVHFGLPEKWQLTFEIDHLTDEDSDSDSSSRHRPNDMRGYRDFTLISGRSRGIPIVTLQWGNPKELPNGSHYFAADDMEKSLHENIHKTALQTALVIGRDQELREAGIDPANPPRWARATTPIMQRALEAFGKIRKPRNKWLGEQEIFENGAVLMPDRDYYLSSTVVYGFDWWRGYQSLTILNELPRSVLANIENMPIHRIVSIPGIDLKGIDAQVRVQDDHLRIAFDREDLVRLETAPDSIEADPVKAWLEAAKRSA